MRCRISFQLLLVATALGAAVWWSYRLGNPRTIAPRAIAPTTSLPIVLPEQRNIVIRKPIRAFLATGGKEMLTASTTTSCRCDLLAIKR